MEAKAKSIENEAAIAAETARATAEQELQRLRAELEKLRLECDVVLPAEAARLASEARARGEAAPLVENGKAAAEALRLVSAEWKTAGKSGREVYLLQQLRSFVESAVARVAQTEVGELKIVDGGDGQAYAAFVANFPAAVARVMAETAQAVGVDVRALLGSKEMRPMIARPLRPRLAAASSSSVTVTIIMKRLLYVSAPNEALIFSGRIRRVGNREVGYRVVRGGRALRVPLFEVVDSVDLTNIAIDIEVKGAYSKGGIPLNVHGVANIKLPGEEPLLNNAIERFLGKPRHEIMRDRQGDAGGQPARRAGPAHPGRGEPGQDALRPDAPGGGRTRPQPDGPRARHPQDPEHHRRRRLPELHRPHPGRPGAHGSGHRGGARHRRRRRAAGHNWAASEIAKVDADLAIARQETDKRIADARTRREALIAESEGQVLAEMAQVKAEIERQKARALQVKRKLDADVVQVAEADRRAREEQARGFAARVIERGKAEAAALSSVFEAFTGGRGRAGGHDASAGDPAPQPGLGGGRQLLRQGHGAARERRSGGDFAKAAIRASEQIKAATGLDVTQLAKRIEGGGAKVDR